MMWEFVTFVVDKVQDFWYIWIFIMMTIESSFIPFPSEVAMIPAGYLSSQGQMNIYLAFLFGTLGALMGSIINYIIGIKLWGPVLRSLVARYGKYIFVSLDHYSKAESFFEKHGGITTFNGRFIPAVRQLISLPAGVFKYNFTKFCIFTFVWAGIWNIILLSIGYIAWENKALIAEYSHEAIIGTLVFIAIASGVYYLINKYTLWK